MPINSETINRTQHVDEIWVTEDENDQTRRLAYKINKRNWIIKFYPKNGDFFLDEITIEGFRNLPEDFSDRGYIKQGVQYYLNRKLENRSISSLTISRDSPSGMRKVRNQELYKLTLNYGDFEQFRNEFLIIQRNASNSKNDVFDGVLFGLFPEHFPESQNRSSHKYRNVVQNLSSEIIQHFTPNDLAQFERFIVDLLQRKYQNNHHQFMQLARTKVEVDTVAIDRILSEFQENLDQNISENDWGKFLKKNLFLLDSKYVKVISELNVMLGGNRNVDFGMIDSKGYLDIFEIKRPSTQLLHNETDRGNYFWHTSTVKAIVQAEKYLFNAERHAANLAEGIRREARVNVSIVKPRAILVIGYSDQLDSEQKSDDFKVLRQSLKNVEIILYDELLEGLENQKNKYYDQILEPEGENQ